jgi:hypothetical protein
MLDCRFRAFACSTLLVAGCSVLNSFDELGEIKEAGGSGGSGGSDVAGSENGGGPSPDAGAPSEAGQGGTAPNPEGGAAGDGGTPPVEMGGEGGGPNPVGPPGLIVVSGKDTDGNNAPVLSVLSPQTGKELKRESVTATMFAHDGPRDIWYVSTIKDGTAQLIMRHFDRGDNTWTDLGEPLVIPVNADTSANGWVALRQRFVYLSSATELVVIDSTDPAALQVQTKVTLASAANGLVGSFGNNLGGIVNIVRTSTGCLAGSKCDVTLARVQIKATGNLLEDAAVVVGEIPNPGGRAAWGANTVDGNDVMITPNAVGTQATLLQLNPGTHAPLAGTTRSFAFNSIQPRGFAYDSCSGLAFTAELVAKSGNTTVYAVPDGVGTVGVVQPPQATQGVFFEPYTRTLLTPFSSGNNYDMLAYAVTGTSVAPKLTKRAGGLWAPPGDINPNLVAVAMPYPAECE